MVEEDRITELAGRIAREYHPERIILFGSHARGTPTRDSDVDLLVVVPCEGQPVWKAVEILNRLDPHFPIDLLVRTPEQVRQRLEMNDFFMREIMEKGRVLYEAAHC
jgi:predicted nucleotidyltransferase